MHQDYKWRLDIETAQDEDIRSMLLKPQPDLDNGRVTHKQAHIFGTHLCTSSMLQESVPLNSSQDEESGLCSHGCPRQRHEKQVPALQRPKSVLSPEVWHRLTMPMTGVALLLPLHHPGPTAGRIVLMSHLVEINTSQ